MARVCDVTGKKPMVGNNVSHANNKTKRRFLPNLQYRRFWVESENRWVRLRVSGAALRLIDKNGIDAVLADLRARLATRTLVVFILDATWALGRKMLRLSPVLQALPRLMFTPAAPSRYVIKQQPHPACLSTLEATHELLTALAAAGLDDYPLPAQLPAVFDRLQAFQLQCAADPDRVGYRHRPYKTPAERRPNTGASGRRRRKLFDLPAG